MNLRHPSPLTLVAALLLAVPPLALGAHQDDAGSGGDAPDQRENALVVTPSTFTGQVAHDEGDWYDWYAVVDLPADKGVAVFFRPDRLGNIYAFAPGSEGSYPTSSDGVRSFIYLDPQPAGIDLRVSGNTSYEVTVSTFERPNVRVDDIRVIPRHVTTDMGPVSAGTQRDVVVRLSNVGTGPTTPNNVVRVFSDPISDPWARGVGWARLELAPGATGCHVFHWDATGQAGDMEVTVEALVTADADRADNIRSARSYAVAGGLGIGVDAVGREVHPLLLPSMDGLLAGAPSGDCSEG